MYVFFFHFPSLMRNSRGIIHGNTYMLLYWAVVIETRIWRSRTENHRLFPEKSKHNIIRELWLVADNTEPISGLQQQYSLSRRVHIVFVYYYYEGEMEVMCRHSQRRRRKRRWRRRVGENIYFTIILTGAGRRRQTSIYYIRVCRVGNVP